MNLCSDDHEEICYDGKRCPLCHVKEELSSEIQTLTQTIESLKDKITELEDRE